MNKYLALRTFIIWALTIQFSFGYFPRAAADEDKGNAATKASPPSVTFAANDSSATSPTAAETAAFEHAIGVANIEGVGNVPVSAEGTRKDLENLSPKKLLALMQMYGLHPKPTGGEILEASFQNGKSAMLHAIKGFPIEAVIFYMAVGAVEALHYAASPNSNPIRMQEEWEHIKSPLGGFGFLVFTSANAVVPAVLGTLIRNEGLAKHLGMLGMTAGFFLQNVVNTIAADPLFQACTSEIRGDFRTYNQSVKKDDKATISKTIIDQETKSPCQDFFSAKVLTGKIIGMAPSLVSMLLSGYLSGKLTAPIKSGRVKLRKIVMKSTKVLFKSASKSVAKGIRISTLGRLYYGVDFVGGKITDIMAFVGTDGKAVLHAVVTPPLKWMSHATMDNASKEVQADLISKKSSKWVDQLTGESCSVLQRSSSCKPDFSSRLKNLHHEIHDFQRLTMSGVEASNAVWARSLTEISQKYLISQDFYGKFLLEGARAYYAKDPKSLQQTFKPILIGIDPFAGISNYSIAVVNGQPAQTVDKTRLLDDFQRDLYNKSTAIKFWANYFQNAWMAKVAPGLVNPNPGQPFQPVNWSLSPSIWFNSVKIAYNATSDRLFEANDKYSVKPGEYAALNQFFNRLQFPDGERINSVKIQDQANLLQMAQNYLTDPEKYAFMDLSRDVSFSGLTLNADENKSIVEGLQLHLNGHYPFTEFVLKEFFENLGVTDKFKNTNIPGETFFKNYDLYSNSSDEIKALKAEEAYPKQLGRFNVNNFSEELLVNMLCGPQVYQNEKTIDKQKMLGIRVFGFKHTYTSPSIVRDFPERANLCKKGEAGIAYPIYTKMWDAEGKFVYVQPMTPARNDRQQKYRDEFAKGSAAKRTAVHSLITLVLANLDPLVIYSLKAAPEDKIKDIFNQWWDKNIMPELAVFYNNMNLRYREIVADLVSMANDPGLGLPASYKFSSNPVISLQQEFRFYTMMLNELIKDVYKTKFPEGLPALKLRSSPAFQLWLDKPIPFWTDTRLANSKQLTYIHHLDLFHMLWNTRSLDWAQVMAFRGEQNNLGVINGEIESLTQANIAFEEYAKLLSSPGLKQAVLNPDQIYNGPIGHKANLKTISAMLGRAKSLIGDVIGEITENGKKAHLQLNNYQMNFELSDEQVKQVAILDWIPDTKLLNREQILIAQTIFQILDQIGNQLYTTTEIVGAVSWYRGSGKSANDERRRELNLKEEVEDSGKTKQAPAAPMHAPAAPNLDTKASLSKESRSEEDTNGQEVSPGT